MEIIPVLIGWAVLAAILIPLLPGGKIRGIVVYAAAAGMMLLTLFLFGSWLAGGTGTVPLYPQSAAVEYVNIAMLSVSLC